MVVKLTDIELNKINEVYIQITTEPSIDKEISEYFKYRMPNYQFSPAGKKGWQGWIYLYKNQYLYAGLLKYLLDFARERKYTIKYNPDLFIYNNFSKLEAAEFIKSLNLKSRDQSLEAREYQEIGLAKAIRYKRLTMISPTRSGKSMVLYCYTRYLLNNNPEFKGLLIVPTTSLVEQMYTDFEDYSTANQWPVQNRVQRLYSGYSSTIEPNTQLLISTWQSLLRLPDSYFERFDFIIGDEAHTFSAKEIGSVAGRCVNAAYRLACTGTTHDDDVNNLKVEGYFGPISKLTTTRKLMDDGHIATLYIKSIVLKHPPGTQKIIDKLSKGVSATADYKAELDYIIDCKARNRFIRNLALSIEGNTLLMFHYERHGRIIFDMIKEKLGESSRRLFFVNGETETEVREQVRKISDGEQNSIIVGSFVFSTGITIRNLNNVVFATPTKAKIKTLQSIGRSLGLGDNKVTATLYDIADDCTELPDDEPNFTLRHYHSRMKLYQNEKFNISHYKIQLKEAK